MPVPHPLIFLLGHLPEGVCAGSQSIWAGREQVVGSKQAVLRCCPMHDRAAIPFQDDEEDIITPFSSSLLDIQRRAAVNDFSLDRDVVPPSVSRPYSPQMPDAARARTIPSSPPKAEQKRPGLFSKPPKRSTRAHRPAPPIFETWRAMARGRSFFTPAPQRCNGDRVACAAGGKARSVSAFCWSRLRPRPQVVETVVLRALRVDRGVVDQVPQAKGSACSDCPPCCDGLHPLRGLSSYKRRGEGEGDGRQLA